MYFANEHLDGWVRSGTARIVPGDISARFAEYLERLPWNPSGIGLDWQRLRGKEVNFSDLSGARRLDWLSSTCLSGDPYIIFWYAPREHGIACETPFALSNIDRAFWNSPGRCYVFGADLNKEGFQPYFHHFAEYNTDSGTFIAASEADIVAFSAIKNGPEGEAGN